MRDYLFWCIQIKMPMLKDLKLYITYQQAIIRNYNVIFNGKNFFGQPIDSDTKQYEEIKNLSTGQGEDYTTVCILDYEYVKNNYRKISVDLSRQKSTQQKKLVGQFKNRDNGIVNNESMFVLPILEKIKQMSEIKIFSRKRNSIIKDD